MLERTRQKRLAAVIVILVACAGALTVWTTRQAAALRAARQKTLSTQSATSSDNASTTRESTQHKPTAWRPESPQLDHSQFVGTAACARCHAEIAAEYARHPMGRSSARVTATEAGEDNQQRASFSPAPGLTYLVETCPDGVWHHERLADEQGAVLYDQAVRVDLAIGSGQRGRSYLINRDGLLFMSPLSWYSPEHVWDLSPSYLLGRHPRFERRALDGCVACHIGRLDPIPQAPDRYRSEPVLEAAIGCERCHGPGRDHVAHRSGQTSVADRIVNPGQLEPRARESVCNQCHLQGELRVLQPGRHPQDFQPGSLLDETWVVFVRGTGTDGVHTEAVSQVEQMRCSRCFQQSGEKLGCVSCHDPHSLPTSENRSAFYRRRCLNCHQEQSCSAPPAERQAPAVADSCIVCHMPKLGAEDIPHTTQTDHRVPRRPGGLVAASSSVPIEIFDDAKARLSQPLIDRAWGIYWQKKAERSNDQALLIAAEKRLRAALAADRADVEVLDALAVIAMHRGQLPEAVTLFQQVLAESPERESTWRNLAAVSRRAGRSADAKQAGQRFLQLNPWHSVAQGMTAELLWSLGERPAAIEAAKLALELDPSLLVTRRWLAQAYREVGQLEDSRRETELLPKLAAAKARVEESAKNRSPRRGDTGPSSGEPAGLRLEQ